MKVALVIPKSGNKLATAGPPLNLGYLASYLRKYVDDVNVKIIDGIIGQDDKKLLEDFKPDLVGLTATTPQINDAYRLADWIRSRFGNQTHIVMGGVHVSVLPQEAISHCDTVIVGEGERALSDIIQREYYPEVYNGVPINNLDEIPSPAFDLIDIEGYMKSEDNSGKMILDNPRCVPLITSRGCPYRCAFCWNSFRVAQPRYHSAQRILDDLTYLKEHYSINCVWFVDDEFAVNKKRLKEIDKLFTENKLDIPWGCQARATTLDVETMLLMKHSGCKHISVGFESGNRRILDLLKAHSVSLEDNEQVLSNGKKAGMPIGGSFILGTPSETREEMYDTLRFIEKHDDLAFAGIGTLIPYPSTKIWETCLEKNLLPKKVDYDKLIPTPIPENTYIICDTMSRNDYVKTFRDIHIIIGITQKVRDICRSSSSPISDFLKLFRLKRMWYFTLYHPLRFSKLFLKTLRTFFKKG